MECVLLTGANSSIGSAIAKTLSSNFRLILSGRRLDELHLILSKLDGTGHLIWLCDFEKDDIGSSLANFLEKNQIKPNHFLHLGGWFSLAPIRLQKKSDTKKLFQINVFSAIEIITILSKKAYKLEVKNILLFSSISAMRGISGYSVYASAKSALLGLMKSLAIELVPIKVNVLVLGAIKTKATASIINQNEALIDSKIPLGLAQNDVLNDWINFLLIGNTWMTGQQIVIDGGATAS